MALNLMGFVIGRALAQREGLDQSEANRLGVLQASFGMTPLATVATSEMAKRKAATLKPVAVVTRPAIRLPAPGSVPTPAPAGGGEAPDGSRELVEAIDRLNTTMAEQKEKLCELVAGQAALHEEQSAATQQILNELCALSQKVGQSESDVSELGKQSGKKKSGG